MAWPGDGVALVEAVHLVCGTAVALAVHVADLAVVKVRWRRQ